MRTNQPYKIQTINELRIEKARLREKLQLTELTLKQQTDFVSNHWGWLILSSFLKPKDGVQMERWIDGIIDETVELGINVIDNPQNSKESLKTFAKHIISKLVHGLVHLKSKRP